MTPSRRQIGNWLLTSSQPRRSYQGDSSRRQVHTWDRKLLWDSNIWIHILLLYYHHNSNLSHACVSIYGARIKLCRCSSMTNERKKTTVHKCIGLHLLHDCSHCRFAVYTSANVYGCVRAWLTHVRDSPSVTSVTNSLLLLSTRHWKPICSVNISMSDFSQCSAELAHIRFWVGVN